MITKDFKKSAIVVSLLCAFSLSICQQNSFAVETPEIKAQLDTIEKKVEKDELGEDVYAQLERIIAQDPKNYRAHLYLGNCYAKLGLPDGAVEEFRLATQYGPGEPKAFVELIKGQIKLGQVPSAMQLLDEAKKKFPKDPEVQFWVGNYLLSKNRWMEAEQTYTEALKKGKVIFGLPTSLAEIKLMKGSPEEARDLALKDLKVDFSYAAANRVYGLALASTGKFEESIEPLRRAFVQQPFKEGLADNLAACAVWAGKYKLALEPSLITLGASSSPESNNPREKKRLYDVFRHLSKAEVEAGIAETRKKIGKHPRPSYFFALGDVLDGMGYYKLAMEQYSAGLAQEPTFGRGWFRMGLDLERYARNYDAALECYQKAHAYRPEDDQIVYHLHSLSDKLARRPDNWAWHLRDLIKPAKKIDFANPPSTASVEATR